MSPVSAPALEDQDMKPSDQRNYPENPDAIKQHRTRTDRGVKTKTFQTVIGVHGITRAPCY